MLTSWFDAHAVHKLMLCRWLVPLRTGLAQSGKSSDAAVPRYNSVSEIPENSFNTRLFKVKGVHRFDQQHSL